MSWLFISIAAYFLVALEVILDKFLLSSKRVSHPAVYAFYSGLLSLVALFLFPFGFHAVGYLEAFFSITAGIIFVYGILVLFFAINENEASQVMPVVGATIPLVTFFLSWIFLGEKLSGLEVGGVVLLIFGGLLISFDLPLKLKKRKFFAGFKHSVLAGLLLSVAFTSFKYFFNRDESFVNVYIWTRFGLFSGALTLLFFPAWRKRIRASFKGFQGEKKENHRTGALFIINKALGGTGSILTNYAISLGSVTIVNALVALEYGFIFIFSFLFSLWFPLVFREKNSPMDLAQKIISVIIITAGIVLVSGL